MPNNILITPGSASIQFSGSVANTIRLQVEPSGSIAFYGNSGSLFGISDSLSGSLMSVNDISGLPILEVFSDDRVVMGTFNRNTLVVTGSRVGIDKAVPTADLDISGSVFVTGSLLVQGIVSASSFTGSFSGFSGGAANYIPMWTSATAQSSSAIFQSSGNIGIGTTSIPTGQRLRVAGGDVGFEGQYAYFVNASAELALGASQNSIIRNNDSTNTLAISRTGASSIITFSTAGSERMRITSAGNVGIGTTNPNARLEINNSGASVGNYLRINNTSGKNWELMAGISGISNDGFGIYSVTDSVYRLVITSAGNVGIGTTSPSALLHVSASGTTNDFLVGTNKLFVSASGNVGIATTSPGSRLSLGTVDSSTDTANAIRIWEAGGENGNNYGIGMRGSDGRFAYTAGTGGYHEWFTGNTARWRITPTGILQSTGAQTIQTSTGNLTLATAAGSGHILLTPHGTGNVGIGTTSPSALLHVSASGTTNDLIIGTAATPKLFVSGSGFIGINRTTAYVDSNDRFVVDGGRLSVNAGAFQAASFNRSNNGNITEFLIGGSGRGAIAFDGTNFNVTSFSGMNFLVNTSTNAVFISGSGNVGIGTTSPSAKFHVVGADGGFTAKFHNNSSSTWIQLSASNQSWQIGSWSGGLHFYNDNTSAYRVFISSAGNVGIGTTSPGTLLHVQGSASASTFIGSLSGNASTATVATTVNGTSGQLLTKDDRIIEPNSISNGYLQFGFTSWNNNNTSPYADYLHLRSYSDSSGGADNLVMFLKTGIGMRIYQHVFGTGSAYSNYKDIAFTDGTNAVGSWPVTASSLSGGNAGYIPLWSSTTAQSSSMMFQTANGVLVGRTSKIITETFSSTGYAIIGGTTVQGIIGDAGSGLVTLGGYSNHDVELRTNNTERMRITNGGNVAINTTSPNARLTVNGPITVTGSSGLAGAVLIGGDNQSTFDLKLQRISGGIRAVQHQYAHTNNTPWIMRGINLTWTGELAGSVESTLASRPYYEITTVASGYTSMGFIDVTSGAFTTSNFITNLALRNDGKVGIGTISPDANLTVQGQASFNSGSLTNPGIAARGNLNTGIYFPATDTIGFVEGGSEVMRITSAGNVGIGTTTPQYKQDVISSANTFAASFGTNVSVGSFSGIHFGYLEQANTSYRKSALVFERTDNNLQGANASGKIHVLLNNFGGNSATALTSAVMTIDSNASGSNGTARVGISNRSPSSSLHIVGDSVTPGLLQLQNSSLAQVLYVSSSGNVGIGTLTPGYILDVNGSVNFTSTTRINTVTYTWPSSQGSSNTYLRNNGAGTLSWTSVTSTGDPSLNIIKATLFSAF